MAREDVIFHSQGERVRAHYYRPDDAREPVPAVVLCPGIMGTRATMGGIFVEPLVEAGYGVLLADYRGWGESEGEAGAIYPLNQVEDIRAGLSYLETRPDVASQRLGLFGMSFGGGNATYVAGVDPRVRAAVAVFALADGAAWLRAMRREYEWRDFLRELAEDRRQRALTGQSRLVDPTEEIMVATPERRASTRVGVGARTPLACADAILDYRPVDVAGRISPRAMLWICASGDPLIPAEHSRSLYAAAGEPKKLVVLPGDVHHEGYHLFRAEILENVLDWFERYLRRAVDVETQERAP